MTHVDRRHLDRIPELSTGNNDVDDETGDVAGTIFDRRLESADDGEDALNELDFGDGHSFNDDDIDLGDFAEM